MTDLKSTINLPNTEFPMKANLSQREPETLAYWSQINLYEKTREKQKGKPKFILHDGPPYANGHIHIGHAVNKVLKDMIVKSKTLSNYDAPYVPGWDCHGLPIELNVEKKHGKAGLQISPEKFRQLCREYASEQIDIQRDEFKRLGIIGDWDNPYITMHTEFEANIIRSLGTIIKNGHLHQGKKPVHWCVDCGSALAEAEVEYRMKTSTAIDVKFTLLDEAAVFERCERKPHDQGQGQLSIIAWTTTPWSLPGNAALTLGDDIEYVIVQCNTPFGHERFIVAEALLASCMKRYKIDEYRVLASLQGSKLEGLYVQHPFYEKQVRVILGSHVTLDSGTGAVHTAPAHGLDDYLIALKYEIHFENPVGDNGCFLPTIPLFANEHVSKSSEHIIEVLKAHNTLVHAEMIEHSYPHCWRHKTPLIYRATPQWFISMDQNGLRRSALEEVFATQWIPDWGQARFASMLENRPDWCISRQRTWGVPITLFIHKETGEIHPDTALLIEKVAGIIAKEGIDAWYSLDESTLLGDDTKNYRKCTDVLDVWFDSGVTHTAVLKQRDALAFPADIYLEGSDQHRGWFQSAMVTSVGMYNKAPYKTVLTHGFTVDAKGHKMSKSLGNVVAPDKVIQTLGADVLRLWVAATDYSAEMTVSDEILKRTSDTYRRLRNTTRYLLANLNDFDPATDQIKPEQMLQLDRFAVERARLLQTEILEAYEKYQFHIIYQKVHQFCINDLGAFYLDIIKDRQYTCAKNSLARRSGQTAMYHILEALVRWIAPILSFTAEEIWKFIPGKRNESVFLNTWYENFPSFDEKTTFTQAYWQNIMLIRDEVNQHLEQCRTEGSIGSGLEAEVDLYCDENIQTQLNQLEDELRFVLITSSAKVHSIDAAASIPLSALPGLAITISTAPKLKCMRCWHHVKTIGEDTNYPDICTRCVANAFGDGEKRMFA